MDYDNFKVQLETIIEDQWGDEYDASNTVISRLARRAVQLKSELDFTPDDIGEEVTDIVPDTLQDDWEDVIAEFALFVYNAMDIDDYDEVDEED